MGESKLEERRTRILLQLCSQVVAVGKVTSLSVS